jgi:hypothetical protein
MSADPTGNGPRAQGPQRYEGTFRTLAALAPRGRLLRTIFEAEPQCVKLLGPDGSLRMMNPAGLRMIEADSFEAVRGRCIYDFVADEHRGDFRALVEHVFRGERGSLAFRMTGLKGTPRWLETHAVPLPGGGGVVKMALGITSDITDRLLADAALRESERDFRMLFEQAIDAIFVCADDLRILDANPAACLMTRYAREELLGQSATILLDADERGRVPQALAQMEAGEAVGGEWRARRKDGTAHMVEARVKRLPDGRYQAFVRDITERTELQTQLLQAQKMESIGRLAGGIAHDFNNLLTVINGVADLAITSLHGGPMRQDFERIREAGERAATMTRQLLAMSRQQILQPEIIDLNAIVLDMQGMLQRLIGEDVALQLKLSEPLGPIKADASQIEQIILNLAVNARDAMPDGGTLTIATRDVAVGPPAHRPMPPGPHVMLAVCDTGIGMDETAAKRVFEPFFTTKEVGKGTGLGLSTVYGIVKQSGGSVWVDSRIGEGATFTIYFPVVHAPAERRSTEAADADSEGHETILVVEDEPAVRALTQRVLQLAGYRVLTAADGAEALQRLEQLTEPLDLLLTDVVMPGMNGRELATRVTGLRPEIKVLYVTGYTADGLLRRGVLDATSRVVTKPFTARELRRKVRERLDTV